VFVNETVPARLTGLRYELLATRSCRSKHCRLIKRLGLILDIAVTNCSTRARSSRYALGGLCLSLTHGISPISVPFHYLKDYETHRHAGITRPRNSSVLPEKSRPVLYQDGYKYLERYSPWRRACRLVEKLVPPRYFERSKHGAH